MLPSLLGYILVNVNYRAHWQSDYKTHSFRSSDNLDESYEILSKRNMLAR